MNITRTLLIVLVTAMLCVCVATASAVTPVPLTTPAGVCTFLADSYSAAPIGAKGVFGPGCPGYVAPVVTPPVTPGACPPTVLSQRQLFVNVKYGSRAGLVQAQNADQIFNGDPSKAATPFPWVGNRAVTIALNTGQFAALQFAVPLDVPAKYAGRIGFFDTNYLGTPPFPAVNGSIYSVSTCPGDFTVPPVCKAQWNGQDGEYLTFGAPGAGPGICTITPGRVYYINVTHGSIATPAANTCAGSTCAVSMAYFRLQ